VKWKTICSPVEVGGLGIIILMMHCSLSGNGGWGCRMRACGEIY